MLIAIGAALLLSLVWTWLPSIWSRTVIMLQIVALLVAALAAHWRPSWRLVMYPILLAYITYLWDTTLPPPHLPEGELRALLPAALIVGIAGDLLLNWHTSRPFAPVRLPVQAGYVNLYEAAYFLRLAPEVVRARLARTGHTMLTSRAGEEYVALADLLAALETSHDDIGVPPRPAT
jgi:hypothetical protein